MKDEMLFIDGELVDLSDDTQITLNIKSNLFTDLSKIVSNNTYTIKLPKTVRNQRIIGHADLPACNTGYPRQFHQGRYFRNGVEIISDAKVALISVSDKIEMSMTWGNITMLEGIVENDKSLNELNDEDYHIIWKRDGIDDYQTDKPFIVSRMNLGIRNYDSINYIHPSVRVSWLLERIAEDNGILFDFPNAEVNAFIDRMLVPLLNRSGVEDRNNQFGCTMQYDNGALDGYQLTALAVDYYKNDYLEIVEERDGLHAGLKALQPNIKIHVTGNFTFNYVLQTVSAPVFVMYRKVNDVVEEILSSDAVSLEQLGGQTYRVTFSIDADTTTLNADDVVYFAFRDVGFFTDDGRGPNFTLGFMPVVELVMPEGYNGSNGYYPIIQNLPDIKQLDFLKAIAYMTGTFACVSGNKLSFISVDDVVANKSKAMDWTKKVVATFIDNKPNNMTYTLDGFAQNNYYRYKEDDTVKGHYDGALKVDNYTLDYERDVATLPFAASDTMLSDAYIPLYSYGDNEEGTLENVEPRILLEEDNNGKSKAVFSGLSWSLLLSKFYNSYQSLIRTPVVITEKIEVSDIELREIDVTVPVYLAQYGRYYAIISIKAENTGICECKLLQLEV